MNKNLIKNIKKKIGSLKKHHPLFILGSILLIGIVFSVIQISRASPAKPNPGHAWNELECDTNFCVNTATGRVGIGTSTPGTKLDVVGVIKSPSQVLTPQAAAPASPVKGQMYYDDTSNAMKVYNGAAWQTGGGALPTNALWQRMINDFSCSFTWVACPQIGSYTMDRNGQLGTFSWQLLSGTSFCMGTGEVRVNGVVIPRDANGRMSYPLSVGDVIGVYRCMSSENSCAISSCRAETGFWEWQ